jgi:anthranilate synthase/aminodeoxychorismate synthase-like glutamine amidotransferase
VILLIDNYDSFTWNLVQRIGELDATIPIHVVRNDDIDADEAERLSPSHLIVSPGPCTPDQTGACKSIIERLTGHVPILGVCLGHQTIGALAGMVVERASSPVHGKTSPVHHDGRGVFAGLSQPFEATRYHSLIVNRDSVDTSQFEISAWLDDGTVMGLRALGTKKPLDGVQFHPESFLTEEGPRLLANFIGLDLPSRMS